ncbi:MAG: response regulator [Deltaproteobacteria bacterium]|nr:response regulator [Deltaproteobacteria bacterium]
MSLQTVLVLDDNDLYRSVLKRALTKNQFDVTAFPDPKTYLATRKIDHCERNCPCFDFILTDNHMPSMSGLEFFEWGKQNDCKLPVHRKAIISAMWSEEDLDRAQSLGCRVFDKSSSLDHIQDWIENCVGQKAEL